METAQRDALSTKPAPALAPDVAMIVVADDPCDRLAIQRSLRHCTFYFASSVEEAEALTRTGIANSFWVF
jgi:hypothetical protein